jgi:hypothetical protein
MSKEEQLTKQIIEGALALQTFAANAKYVEMIVDIAFAVVPTILGLGAAGLIGSSAIRTAKDVMNSISVLRALGPGLGYLVGFNKMRWEYGKKLQQIDRKGIVRTGLWGLGVFIAPDHLMVSKLKSRWSKRKQNNQDTQGKQEGQAGGGGSGSSPPPPDIKSDKKEEQPKIDGIPLDEYVKKRRKEMGLE